MRKVSILLPLYIKNEHHLFFTEQAFESLVSDDYQLEYIFIENYVSKDMRSKLDLFYEKLKNESISFTAIVTSENNLARAWNLGILRSFDIGIDTVLVPNNDIVAHPKCIDNLVDFIDNSPSDAVLWTALEHSSLRGLKNKELTNDFDEHPGFSFFAYTMQSYERLRNIEKNTEEPNPGLFDENYAPAYFEDQDMHQRILNSKYQAYKTASAVYYHYGSRTINVDQELKDNNFHTYEKNRRYFEKKWGYDSHGRAFSNQERIDNAYARPFDI